MRSFHHCGLNQNRFGVSPKWRPKVARPLKVGRFTRPVEFHSLFFGRWKWHDGHDGHNWTLGSSGFAGKLGSVFDAYISTQGSWLRDTNHSPKKMYGYFCWNHHHETKEVSTFQEKNHGFFRVFFEDVFLFNIKVPSQKTNFIIQRISNTSQVRRAPGGICIEGSVESTSPGVIYVVNSYISINIYIYISY